MLKSKMRTAMQLIAGRLDTMQTHGIFGLIETFQCTVRGIALGANWLSEQQCHAAAHRPVQVEFQKSSNGNIGAASWDREEVVPMSAQR